MEKSVYMAQRRIVQTHEMSIVVDQRVVKIEIQISCIPESSGRTFRYDVMAFTPDHKLIGRSHQQFSEPISVFRVSEHANIGKHMLKAVRALKTSALSRRSLQQASL